MVKYVELNTYLKIKGIAITGGQAKLIIRGEEVKVNNEIETRNKRKLLLNDIVEVNGQKFKVENDYLKKEQ
jgi:ribosome-associated protein